MKQLIKLSPWLKRLYSIQVPFQDDLGAMDLDDLNLGDFKYYKESESLTQYTSLKQPIIFISKLNNPFTNLAIEDYIYNAMPLSHNRLMFYINSPCVVIGKNQNPWQEVNLRVLNDLKIPLLRRFSGGGTVVHDLGNVNYSYMTEKSKFNRFKFNQLIIKNVNSLPNNKFEIQLNERGDIVTTDGFKVSGSAFKLSKGKSYHHGTFLLNSKLNVLRNLLSRDDEMGVVHSKSIDSVKSKVQNMELQTEEFIESVCNGFIDEFETDDDRVRVVEIDNDMILPNEVYTTVEKLKSWDWIFGHTTKFSHTFTKDDLELVFHVDKGLLKQVDVNKTEDDFKYLIEYVNNHDLKYTGSNVAGYVTNDEVSDWIGSCIDGTI
ncbi:unnamed protein product [Candida verbasci]|uniref:Putative lipoate-protein ligase A n=1 Tax=Candida verbasci TaxID=1227364 RepID=A0A9W4TZI0_9ASCO|nr:unnamed protein product [Candida verbasci]